MVTQEQALNELWANKDWKKSMAGRQERFFYATTTKPVDILAIESLKQNCTPRVERTIPVGTTVLVTMLSRFGDVGIRDDRLVPPSHGYHARVNPEELSDWREQP